MEYAHTSELLPALCTIMTGSAVPQSLKKSEVLSGRSMYEPTRLDALAGAAACAARPASLLSGFEY
jgi:hypothetical protein